MILPRGAHAIRAAALRRAAPRLPLHSQALRCLSTATPRRIAMTDGGRAVDDIDLAFDYPSEMQETYTRPAGVHQARIDKEMGYPDQSVLYALVAGIGLIGLYGAVMSTFYPTEDMFYQHMEPSSSIPVTKLSASSTPIEESGQHISLSEKSVHLPSRKPTDSKMERFIGRGG